ncbi:autophagy protein Apg9-domain-containing protein [Naematelia encephala]|uniref:Autophagy-related protein 9 n=1 Tax=Naematelia encephala TaxID=71784 RepID=A0A1Y2APS2_9TREE|nr:autophagy protein Apg9-domain-containing protein [Naematelia encephala]
MSTPPRSNSILNLLNPYASMSRSAYPTQPPTAADPDSPSTFLLRELGGDNDGPGASDSNDRSRMSPTPTPVTPSRRPTRVLSTPSTSDDEGPPRSIVFGGRNGGEGGDRTPKSPSGPLPRAIHQVVSPDVQPRVVSPGPFRAGPSSSSASASTSPGPSTISVYASGLDGTGIEGGGSSEPSREPSVSPRVVPARKTPTFREPPRPGPPQRSASNSNKRKSSPRLSSGPGYLEPSLVSPSDRKGKGKARATGGRIYHAVSSRDVDDGDEREDEEETKPFRGRYAAFGGGTTGVPSKTGLNAYERALWKWVNVDDLDGFLQEVYEYYKGKGIYCIALARVLNLLTTFFVIAFSTFLLSCIDYPKLTSSISGPNDVGRLDDVLIGQCLTRGSFPHMLFILSVAAFYIFQLVTFALSIPRLLEMYRFYTHLLGVPDADIQTLPWPEIVRLIGEIREHNAVTSLSNGQAGALADMVGDDVNKGNVKKLDAHDVANRILRQENYLIALFNKDLLDLRVRLPVAHSLVQLVPPSLLAPISPTTLPSNRSQASERRYISFGANTLTKALEWNLRFCLMGYLFDQRGQVRKEFVRDRRRKDLIQGLRRRFIFMGVLNAIFAPFIVVYLLIFSFFRYFEEYHKNPSSIGSRQYTPYAQWKFREFNELPHLFERRLDRSYPTAKEYIDQFPKERTALVMRFVAFIAGSLSAVLLAASLVDPDLFLHFEITPHRTVLFYLGVFGSILAIARGMVPEENLVFDPEMSLREVVRWTHYLPGEWRGRLHSQMVHQQFSQLFALKITIFFTELLSVLLTPFILFFSLPPCAGAIIDFFREFTVHVDGVGYVCSFAVFDFRRHGAVKPAVHGNTEAPAGNGTTRLDERANENKMEKSFLHFKATHPDWQPSDPSSSVFLDRLVGLHRDQLGHQPNGRAGMSGSMYAGGGRGLGIGGGGGSGGMEESRLRERSRSYDRAWAKSSHLLRPSLTVPEHAGLRHATRELKLETMPESSEMQDNDDDDDDDEDEDEDGRAVIEGGWHKRVGGKSESDDEEGKGYLKDVGVVGLLQQVMGR